LKLPTDPAELLAGHAATLEATYREVGGRLGANTAATFDDDGRVPPRAGPADLPRSAR